VFPPGLRASQRFRTAFADRYRRIANAGPLAAMEPAAGPQHAGEPA
jgi:hypothetical protein